MTVGSFQSAAALRRYCTGAISAEGHLEGLSAAMWQEDGEGKRHDTACPNSRHKQGSFLKGIHLSTQSASTPGHQINLFLDTTSWHNHENLR